MSRRPPKPAPVVVKRGAEERKRLPPELEAFARSDEEKLRIRRPRVDRGRVHDPREGYCIPGVANRDARAVYDQRVAAMQELWQGGAADEAALAELGLLFLDAQRLGLWRARRVMGFAPFAEEVVGVPADQARKLAEDATLRIRESSAQLNEREVALWMRTEAGLYEGDGSARARVRHGANGAAMLELSVALAHASAALAGVGAKHLPLARAEEEKLNGRSALPAKALLAAEPDEEDEVAPAEVAADQGAVDAGGALLGGARLLTRKPRRQNEGDGPAARGDAWEAEGEDAWSESERGEAQAGGARGHAARAYRGEERHGSGERDSQWGKRRARGDGEREGGPSRRFEGQDARAVGAGRGFGGKREGGFGGKREGGFGGKREGGFGGKREGGFGGKREGGFGGKREGGFGGKREGGFGGKREGGFGGKREGGFGGGARKAAKSGAGFGKKDKFRAKGKTQGFGQKRVFERPESSEPRGARERSSRGDERDE